MKGSDCLSGSLENHGVPGNARHTVYHIFSACKPAWLGCCAATLAEADEREMPDKDPGERAWQMHLQVAVVQTMVDVQSVHRRGT